MRFITAVLASYLAISISSYSAEANRMPQKLINISIEFSNNDLNKAIIRAFEEDKSVWSGGHLCIVAYSYLNNGDSKKAVELFEQLCKNDPGNISYALSLGSAYQFVGSFEKAKSVYARIWDEKKSIDALRQLIILFIENDKVDSLDPTMQPLLEGELGDLELVKCLLVYSCRVTDLKIGKSIADRLILKVDPATIDKDQELVRLFGEAYGRFYAASENVVKEGLPGVSKAAGSTNAVELVNGKKPPVGVPEKQDRP